MASTATSIRTAEPKSSCGKCAVCKCGDLAPGGVPDASRRLAELLDDLPRDDALSSRGDETVEPAR